MLCLHGLWGGNETRTLQSFHADIAHSSVLGAEHVNHVDERPENVVGRGPASYGCALPDCPHHGFLLFAFRLRKAVLHYYYLPEKNLFDEEIFINLLRNFLLQRR